MPPKRETPVNGDSSSGRTAANADQATAGASQSTNGTPTPSATPGGTPAAPGRVAPTSRPSPAARGRGSIAPKPKFVGRRSQNARQELEQAEAKKKAVEAAQAAEEARRQAREAKRFGYGRGGGDRGRGRGRGRGGHMADSHRQRDEAVPSGPFGAGQASSEGARRWGSGQRGGATGPFSGGSGGGSIGGSRYNGAGRSTGMTSGSGIKSEAGTDTIMGGMRIKAEDGGYVSSDEDEGPKEDIDRLKVIDLTREDNGPQQHAMAPVRLERYAHKDRTIGLTAEDEGLLDGNGQAGTAVTEKKRGKQRARDIEVTGSTHLPSRPTAYSSSDSDAEPQIKEEPMDDEQQTRPITPEPIPADEAMMKSPQSSPESKRKAKEKVKATADDDLEDEDGFIMPPPPRFQTQAEKDEWVRSYEDMKSLRRELGALVPPSVMQPANVQDDTTAVELSPTTKTRKQTQFNREQHVYLFQFPPVLPDLKPVTVKPDPETADVAVAGETMDVDTVPSKDDEVTIPGETVSSKMPKLPSGSIGKLRIHKSGKATLDWGGTPLTLNKGADATFLQTVMIAELPEVKPKDSSAAAAEKSQDQDYRGLSMGIVRGKFVVTPDWEQILR